jgi:hypothetical protein
MGTHSKRNEGVKYMKGRLEDPRRRPRRLQNRPDLGVKWDNPAAAEGRI